jgi:hypothetical protein
MDRVVKRFIMHNGDTHDYTKSNEIQFFKDDLNRIMYDIINKI